MNKKETEAERDRRFTKMVLNDPEAMTLLKKLYEDDTNE